MKKVFLGLALLSLLPACGGYTQWNDRHYSGVHDDTLGVQNESLYPPPAAIQQPAAVTLRDYENAGPGGDAALTALSRPTQSNGGAGLWVYDRGPREDLAGTPTAQPAAKRPRARRK